MGKHQPKPSTDVRAYTKILRAIDKERKRYRWIVPATCLAVLGAGLTFIIELPKAQPWWQAIIYAGNALWLIFVVVLLIILGRELLQHSDNVDKAIDVGLEHLREACYNKPTLACIKERAQTAGTASVLRTILPAVAVPTALGVLFAQDVVPAELKLFGWLFVVALMSSMLVELLRGSTAFFVLDALAEFQCESDAAALPSITKQTQLGPSNEGTNQGTKSPRRDLPRRQQTSSTTAARRKG